MDPTEPSETTNADSSSEDSSGGEPGGRTPVAQFVMHQVVDNAPWDIVQTTAGIAVDDDNRVFVVDDEHVYMVVGDEVTIWYEPEEPVDRVRDVDVHDGEVWILTDSAVLRSTAPSVAEVEYDLAQLTVIRHLGVVSPDVAAITHRNEGLWLATPDGLGPTLLEEELLGGTSCATQDLAVSKTGRFLYQPGCNGSPIVMGDVHGGPTEVFFDDAFTRDDIYWNALCSTRAPESGFYSLTHTGQAPVIHYVPEEPGSEFEWSAIPTSPSLEQLEESSDEPFAFRYCAVAVAPDDTLFIQTRSQLWRGDPEY